MLTAVLSDLHLGTRSRADVLRDPDVRRILFDSLQEADEIVLLGDVIELREQPLREVLDIAFPFFEELGEAVPDKPITVIAGNHDHRIVAEWLEELRLDGKPLGLEQRTSPSASRPLALIAERMPRNEIELAYPGIWLRPGTYAHHGHYLDAHMSMPRPEVLAISVTARLTGGLPPAPRRPDDYEAAITPLYGFAYALAQGNRRARRAMGMDLSRKVWRRVDTRTDVRTRALRDLGIPSVVWALNRAGMGPFDAKLSGAALRESGLRAMLDVVDGLGLDDAREIVFGHTHRPGPLPQDHDWPARLYNTGSWLIEPDLMDPQVGDSPYWPGCVMFIEDDKPPLLRRLLLDLSHADLQRGHAYS